VFDWVVCVCGARYSAETRCVWTRSRGILVSWRWSSTWHRRVHWPVPRPVSWWPNTVPRSHRGALGSPRSRAASVHEGRSFVIADCIPSWSTERRRSGSGKKGQAYVIYMGWVWVSTRDKRGAWSNAASW